MLTSERPFAALQAILCVKTSYEKHVFPLPKESLKIGSIPIFYPNLFKNGKAEVNNTHKLNLRFPENFFFMITDRRRSLASSLAMQYLLSSCQRKRPA